MNTRGDYWKGLSETWQLFLRAACNHHFDCINRSTQGPVHWKVLRQGQLVFTLTTQISPVHTAGTLKQTIVLNGLDHCTFPFKHVLQRIPRPQNFTKHTHLWWQPCCKCQSDLVEHGPFTNEFWIKRTLNCGMKWDWNVQPGWGKRFNYSFSVPYNTAAIISNQLVSRQNEDKTAAISWNYTSTKKLWLHLRVECSKYCTLPSKQITKNNNKLRVKSACCPCVWSSKQKAN